MPILKVTSSSLEFFSSYVCIYGADNEQCGFLLNVSASYRGKALQRRSSSWSRFLPNFPQYLCRYGTHNEQCWLLWLSPQRHRASTSHPAHDGVMAVTDGEDVERVAADDVVLFFLLFVPSRCLYNPPPPSFFLTFQDFNLRSAASTHTSPSIPTN